MNVSVTHSLQHPASKQRQNKLFQCLELTHKGVQHENIPVDDFFWWQNKYLCSKQKINK